MTSIVASIAACRADAELVAGALRVLAERHAAAYRALSRDYWRMSEQAAGELATARALIADAEQLEAVAASLPVSAPVPLRAARASLPGQPAASTSEVAA